MPAAACPTRSTCHTRLRWQRGIAALELALLALFVMLPMLLGLAAFWDVLQTQQVLTRATGDGARQVSRLLNRPRLPMPDGSRPTDAQMLARATALAHDSLHAALRHHLGPDRDIATRLTVALQPSGAGHWTLDAAYARPALMGAAGGLNFIEPETLRARSFISAAGLEDPA
ncbi:MAG: TadE/TadG family type IV pilus assembly protein [Comamonas sp.]